MKDFTLFLRASLIVMGVLWVVLGASGAPVDVNGLAIALGGALVVVGAYIPRQRP